MDRASLIRCAIDAYRRDFVSFVAPSLLSALLFVGNGELILLLPVPMSLMAVSAARNLDIVPEGPLFWLWFKRVAQYWLNLLLVMFLVFLCWVVLIGLTGMIFGGPLNERAFGEDLAIVLSGFVALSAVLRAWPLVAAAFLVEGRIFYWNPFHRHLPWFLPWAKGPAWLGPSVVRAIRWTSHPEVARKISPLVVTGALFSWIALVAVLYLPGVSRIVALFLVFLFLVSPLVTFSTAGTWLSLLYAGESPLVTQSGVIPPLDDELARVQRQHAEARLVVHRFPERFGDVSRFVLPRAVVEERRSEILESLRTIGGARSGHGGDYIMLWKSVADMRNDLHPEAIVDLQGDVLLVCIPEWTSKVGTDLESLLVRWNHEFPVMGLI